MTDRSFTGWHMRLYCDHRLHVANDPTIADYCEEMFATKREGLDDAKRRGWIISKGKHICPKCAKLKEPEND